MMETFAQHAALTTLLLPILGAVFVRRFGRNDGAVRQWFAVTNTLCTVWIVILAIFFYRAPVIPQESSRNIPIVQLGDRWPWLTATLPGSPESSSGVWFSVGYDGFSLWTALQVAVLFAAVAMMQKRQAARTNAWWAAFLCWEAALLLTLLAQDVVLLMLAYLLSVLLVVWMVGIWGRIGRRQTAARWLNGQLLALGMIGLSLSLIVAAYPWLKADLVVSRPAPTTSLPQLLNAIPQLTHQNAISLNYWIDVVPWAGWLLGIGLLMRLGIWPFHARWTEFLQVVPDDVRILLYGVWLPVQMHGVLRLLCVLLPDYFMVLNSIAAMGVLWGGLLSLTQTEWRAWMATVCTAGFSLCLCGATSATLLSLLGGWQAAHLWSLCAAGLMFSLAQFPEDVTANSPGTGWQHLRGQPAVAFCFCLFGTGITLLPAFGLCGSFDVLWLELWRSGANSLWSVLVGWLCICCSALNWSLSFFLPETRMNASPGISIGLSSNENPSTEGDARLMVSFSTPSALLIVTMCVVWIAGGDRPNATAKATLLRWLPVLIEPDPTAAPSENQRSTSAAVPFVAPVSKREPSLNREPH